MFHIHKIKLCFYILFTFFVFLTSNHTTYAEESSLSSETIIEEFNYEFEINKVLYSGTYTGETANGIPNGIGKFTTNELSPEQFTYEGNFKDGTLNGDGLLTYADGEVLDSRFSNGLATGLGKLLHTNGSYSTIRHSNGVPYSISLHYSNEGILQGYDFYYDGYLISDLISDTQIINYRSLYENSDKYFGSILSINCTVTAIYETISSCVFQVADENNNLYWGTYKNTGHQKYNQSIMPTLQIGDTLNLYAYFCGITSYTSDNVEIFSTLPELTPIIGITNEVPINREKRPLDYAEILKHPYDYYKVSTTLKGTVVEILYNNDKSSLKLLSSDNNYYYFSFDNSKIDITPIINDYIKIKGTFKGLYKETSGDNVSLYPALNLTSIKILNKNK